MRGLGVIVYFSKPNVFRFCNVPLSAETLEAPASRDPGAYSPGLYFSFASYMPLSYFSPPSMAFSLGVPTILWLANAGAAIAASIAAISAITASTGIRRLILSATSFSLS